jgi:hypothetical protein
MSSSLSYRVRQNYRPAWQPPSWLLKVWRWL